MRFYTTNLNDQLVQFWEWVGVDNPYAPKLGFYEGASGACVIFDVRSLHSFEQAKRWIRVLQADYKINPILLLANNCQDKTNRIILSQDGRFLAETKKVLYFEVYIG
ncbi:MAG: ras-related protein RHN1-like [Promethearchaeota archaeon CR_4]|nr:MAG: ras-related protein RHN1-like [Candidatus Lokiarchaeota archaeon CR_4]